MNFDLQTYNGNIHSVKDTIIYKMPKSLKRTKLLNGNIALTTCHNFTQQKTKTEFVLLTEQSISNMSNRMH